MTFRRRRANTALQAGAPQQLPARNYEPNSAVAHITLQADTALPAHIALQAGTAPLATSHCKPTQPHKPARLDAASAELQANAPLRADAD